MEREIKPREREKEEEKREGGSGRIRKERGFRKHPKERFSEKKKARKERKLSGSI